MNAEVLKKGCFDIQVCVPSYWSNEQTKVFADSEYPCGTENGWRIRHEGDKLLAGDPERVSCSDKFNYVHIMMDA